MHLRIAWSIGLFFVTTVATAASFTDIGGYPSEDAIRYLYDQNIINGYPDGTFKPDQSVNRAELLKILVGGNGVIPSLDEFHDCFSDVQQEWFAPYVCYAKEQGWVSGYPDGTFKPAQTVMMVEAIKMIIQSYEYIPNQTSSTASYEDVDPGSWYAPFVNIARLMGIIDSSKNTLGTQKHMTRGEIANMIFKGIVARNATKNPLGGSLIRRIGPGGTGSDSRPIMTFNDITKTYGDANFTLQALSNSLGNITYTSSNENVIRMNGSTAIVTGVGTSTITAVQAASGRFSEGIATMTVSVMGTPPTITFNNLTKSYIDDDFTLSPTSNSPGAFTFTSSNTSIVSISGNTAVLPASLGNPAPAGLVTITASQAASGNYAAATKSMTLTVYYTYCIASPCINGGTCIPQFSGDISAELDNMTCECPEHYSGVTCEMSDTNCFENGGDLLCMNSGSCVPSEDNGTCDCINGFCGTYCQTLPSQCGI